MALTALETYFRKRKTESITLTEVEYGFLGFKGKWIADRSQQQAAWELYVELVTRIAIQPLEEGEGLLREALSSLYALFSETRAILKKYGPGIATPLEPGALSLAQIALTVLTRQLRPLLSKWHPALQAFESTRASGQSPAAHEASWPHAPRLRAELATLRRTLALYGTLLARACGIEPLHPVPEDRGP